MTDLTFHTMRISILGTDYCQLILNVKLMPFDGNLGMLQKIQIQFIE